MCARPLGSRTPPASPRWRACSAPHRGRPVSADYSSGFGGKYGVQADRVDRSAVGFDYQGKTEKHESQRGPSTRGAAPAVWGASLRESRVPRVSSGALRAPWGHLTLNEPLGVFSARGLGALVLLGVTVVGLSHF